MMRFRRVTKSSKQKRSGKRCKRSPDHLTNLHMRGEIRCCDRTRTQRDQTSALALRWAKRSSHQAHKKRLKFPVRLPFSSCGGMYQQTGENCQKKTCGKTSFPCEK